MECEFRLLLLLYYIIYYVDYKDLEEFVYTIQAHETCPYKIVKNRLPEL
jgi:hypothetical protein